MENVRLRNRGSRTTIPPGQKKEHQDSALEKGKEHGNVLQVQTPKGGATVKPIQRGPRKSRPRTTTITLEAPPPWTFPNNSGDGENLFRSDEETMMCRGPKAESQYDFKLVVTGVYVYSAYWDHRANDFDNKYGGVKVRMMAAIMGRNYRPTLRCTFDMGNQGPERTTLVTYYEMCENHNRKWGGFIMSCEVPSEVQDRRLCAIRVSGEGGITDGGTKPNIVKIPVRSIQPRPKRYTFSMCVPPLFGRVNSSQLVEFLEMSQMLGAEHITMYNFSINPALNSTLKHYVDAGRLMVLPWPLPQQIDKSVWYHGQILAVQDCLFRHMGMTEFVSFNDIDEFIVPRMGHQWKDFLRLLRAPTDNQTCGYKFKSAFFNPRAVPVPPLNPEVKLRPSLITSMNQRSAMMSSVRTKCMVRPHRIFEMGIHHISKPILARLGGVNVDSAHALLHHYRPCLPGFGMNCKASTQDDTALHYSEVLYKKVILALKKIREGAVPGR